MSSTTALGDAALYSFILENQAQLRIFFTPLGFLASLLQPTCFTWLMALNFSPRQYIPHRIH
jgi:hypothetical protein